MLFELESIREAMFTRDPERARHLLARVHAVERLLIELADRFLRHGTVGIVDERKATRAAGLAIDRQHDGSGLSDA